MFLRVVCADPSLVKAPTQLTVTECYRIGRSSRCAFVVSDLSVSRFHAELTIRSSSVLVKDLKSRNGTFVDNARIEEAEAGAGQTVRCGNVSFHLAKLKGPGSSDSDRSELSTHLVTNLPQQQVPAVQKLSEAQRRVLDLLLTGLSEKQVAQRLDLSQHTVHNHVREIYRRMGVSSRPELLALFLAQAKKPRLPSK